MLEAIFHTAAGTAVISAPIEVEAVSIDALVLALMTAASEVLAVLTVVFTLVVALLISTLVASEPVVSPAPVSVLVPLVQTSAARVP